MVAVGSHAAVVGVVVGAAAVGSGAAVVAAAVGGDQNQLGITIVKCLVVSNCFMNSYCCQNKKQTAMCFHRPNEKHLLQPPVSIRKNNWGAIALPITVVDNAVVAVVDAVIAVVVAVVVVAHYCPLLQYL